MSASFSTRLTLFRGFHSIKVGGLINSEIMDIRVDSRNDVTIVRLQGKFLADRDGPLCRDKMNELIQSGRRKFLFDFSGVPYIDSTGLGFLAGCRAAAQRAGAGLVLASLDERVRRVLDEVKLSEYFLIAEDEAHGIARLDEISQS
ncbi:MAG: anti-sigma factor antagonist [Acidobacteria bacterium]|nr:MAG: anti-sigma factor antagonist [Acidobacteriota bacterium]